MAGEKGICQFFKVFYKDYEIDFKVKNLKKEKKNIVINDQEEIEETI